MKDIKEIIKDYNDITIDIYIEHDLQCLRGLNHEYQLNGKNIYKWYHEATHFFEGKNKKFNFSMNIDDLILKSDEIMYFTANVILYEKFMNDPSKDVIIIEGGRPLFRNFQNIPSKRFDFFSDACIEKLYNYWDRIGDLIAACVTSGLKEREIYFSTAVEKIPDKLKDNENFKWLKLFQMTKFKEINEKRINIVHYSSTETDFRYEHLKASTDETKIKELMQKRRSLPHFFKEAIGDTLKGFQNTLDFLINAQKKFN
jgi:hypothetical protein